jgi:hypothetical protein
MLDLTRTNPGVPEEVHGYLRFVTWWVTEKILVASTVPSKEEQARKANLNTEALQALEYLYDEGTPFPDHAACLGADADAIREALVGYHPLPRHSQYTEERRRALRIRLYWWRRSCTH